MIRRKEKSEGLVPREYWWPTWVTPMSILEDMDRMFEDFRSSWERSLMIPRAFASDFVRQPLVDVADNGTEYIVKAEVPGIKKEDLNIEITENSIEISGETKAEEKEEDKKKGYLRHERRYSSFYRSIPLPDAILTDKAEAELKDGVLTVTLPKAAPPEKKSQKLKVK